MSTVPRQQIRFCAAPDGVRLAYATSGAGPPLVKASNWLSHLEFDWVSPVWRHWLRELSKHHTLLRYDERGCGLSDWDMEDCSLEAWVRDLETVVDAAGLERFPLLGISQGGPIAITYASRHPEKVSHLILYGSYARGRQHRNLAPQGMKERELMLQLVKHGWGQENPAFRQVFTSFFIPEGTPEQVHWFNELERISTSPDNAARMLGVFDAIDVRELCPEVKAPTLVLHAQAEQRIPFEEGRLLASLIPDARFVPLESRNHILLENEPAWLRFLTEVRQFLGVEEDVEGRTIRFKPKVTSPQADVLRSGTNERWREISRIFDRAAALHTDERAAYLREACAGDTELRREIESLLESDDQTGWTNEVDRVVEGSLRSLHEDEETLEGRTILHYQIERKLGEGGMGMIYRARDLRLERSVALKFLPRFYSANRELKQRFIQEAKAAASLDHENICTVFEIGETKDQQLYISMPCYEGETLKEKIERGPLPLAEALAYAAQIAEGLAHAHEAGIIHRDIKPANLFVTRQGRVKILDFGVAKVSDVSLTTPGMVLGTVAYMSPEQARGMEVDARSDVFSLSAVLYEMIAGRAAFEGQAAADIVVKILESEPVPLTARAPQAPPELEQIVLKGLVKKREERYQTIRSMALDLKALRQLLEF